MAKENTAAVSSEKEITEEEQAPKKKIKKNADLLPSKKEKMTVGQIILLALLFLFTVFCFADLPFRVIVDILLNAAYQPL